MITIEVATRKKEFNKKLVKYLVKQLPRKAYFSFLYEPELIIRTRNKYRKYITDYLKGYRLPYKVYPYPLTKKGFGENKKGLEYKYNDLFVESMGINSRLALRLKDKEKTLMGRRISHVMYNAFGYGWLGEAQIHQSDTNAFIDTIRFYERLSPIALILCVVIIGIGRFNLSLIKLLI